jgi:hypothetical protein
VYRSGTGCPRHARRLKFSEKLRTLFVGGDSNTLINNFLWAVTSSILCGKEPQHVRALPDDRLRNDDGRPS